MSSRTLEELLEAGEVKSALVFKDGMIDRDKQIVAFFQENEAALRVRVQELEAEREEANRQYDELMQAHAETLAQGADLRQRVKELQTKLYEANLKLNTTHTAGVVSGLAGSVEEQKP